MKSLKRVEGINVVPLIDIMLVLLAIVLTVSSFIALGKIDITLPDAQSYTKVDPKFFEVGITADHRFYVNNELTPKSELALKFDTLSKQDTIAISADKASSYEDFMYVIDLLKLRTIEKIGMVVKKND